LFDCGSIDATAEEGIVLQDDEIGALRWVAPAEAGDSLSGPVGRRVGQALRATTTVYLEDGRPVPGVSG
jgi:hypothetical protein